MGISKTKRKRVYKDSMCEPLITCGYCSNDFDRRVMEVDHVFPKSLGGSDDYKNLIASCANCNRLKADMLLTEFIKRYNIKLTKKLAKFL